jgi:adhesin/invasin
LLLNNTRRSIGALAALLAFSLSCDSSTGPKPDPGTQTSLQLSTVTASQASIVADGKTTSQVTVALKDSQGALLTKSGGAVTISATRGTVGPVNDQNNGTYTATLTSSVSAGQSVVSATLGGASIANTATVNFIAGPAAAIAVANAASNGQTAVVGATVPNPPSVKIADVNGNPVPNVSVTFAVTGGGGSATGATQTTNDAGIATVGSWRLGNSVGANSMTATVAGAAISGGAGARALADLVVTFTATATAGTAGSIAINAGNGQTAVAGNAVATAPSVKVTDGNGNPVSGASVNFFIASGGGSVTGGSTATNSSGIATVGSWILGDIAGANTLTAAAVGLSGTVTFSATGIVGPAASMSIGNASSNNQSAAAGSAVAIAPSVKVVDAKGNPVSGVSVTFAVASGGGSITGANATTDAAGIAQVGSWTLGSAAGPNSLTATSGSLTGSPVTFNATGTSGAAGGVTIVSGDAQSAIAGSNVAIAPSVKVTDANGNAIEGATVVFAIAGGGGSVTGANALTNASGIATVGSWKLGTVAGTNTLSATSGALPAVTFTASGTAGAAALIVINSGNNQNATAGTAVGTPPSAKVTDANGNVVAGAAVTFAVASGGGSITGASTTTGANGVATVGSWTLGSTAGPNSLSATLNGLPGQAVTFNATGTALAGLNVSVTGRLERSETITVTVTQDGSTVPPASVTLTLVPADGGTVNADGTVKLLKSGSLTINAEAGTRSGSTTLTVAQPPLIVFDLVRNFSRQIWQVAIDGGDLLQLTTVGSDNQHPSKVGAKVVYAGARNGRAFDLFSLNVLTSVETQLTNTTYADRDPNLSPNGNRLVYVSSETGLDRAIYSSADGSSAAFVDDISNNTGAVEISPAWSPGSDKVILSTTATGGTPDIWIQNALGGIATKMPSPVNTTSAEINPVWNSAGKIAFHTTRSGTNEIWITDPTGATATKLTDGAAPAWLPDGRLVFVRFSGSTGSLFWIDPANPSVVHAIDFGGGDAQRPSAVLP